MKKQTHIILSFYLLFDTETHKRNYKHDSYKNIILHDYFRYILSYFQFIK